MRVRGRIAAAVVALVGAAFVVAPSATASELPAGSSFTSRVVKVIDGDTFKLANDAVVRLIGYDTPEKGKCGDKTSTSKMKKLVLGKKVKVPNSSLVKNKDNYGRALRWVPDFRDIAPSFRTVNPRKTL